MLLYPFALLGLFRYSLLPQVLMTSIMFFFAGNMIFSLAYFAPTIIRGMGYSAVRTQLMSVPPYAATFVCSVGIGILSDRWGQRGYSVFFSGALAMIGYMIFLTSSRTPVLYGSIFLQTMGAFTSAPAIGTWNVNNVQPHYKRSTSIALSLAMANCGGILSTWIFNDPPRFRKAAKINLAFSFGLCVLAIINRVWLAGKNKRKQAERAQRKPMRSEEEEAAEKRRLGDDHPDFIYTL
jgi:predicted MFS family arabinose efflux permease